MKSYKIYWKNKEIVGIYEELKALMKGFLGVPIKLVTL